MGYIVIMQSIVLQSYRHEVMNILHQELIPSSYVRLIRRYIERQWL